jgi:hypothetical protein
VAERALDWASAHDRLPTPLDDVGAAAGVAAVKEAAALPEDIAVTKPRVWKRILGPIVFREKTIYVDRESQIAPRANFT